MDSSEMKSADPRKDPSARPDLPSCETPEDEELLAVSRRLIEYNHSAYEVLAQ